MTNISTINELQEMAKKDLFMDKSELVNESLKTPSLHNKWLNIFIECKKTLHELQKNHSLLYRSLWLYYSGKAPASVYKEKPFDVKLLKTDVKMFIETDEGYLESEQKLKNLQTMLNFIEATIGEINKRSFHIKNAIDMLKFENGEM